MGYFNWVQSMSDRRENLEASQPSFGKWAGRWGGVNSKQMIVNKKTI